jgi:5-methylcytosine-specific restriction endonuclease McrA
MTAHRPGVRGLGLLVCALLAVVVVASGQSAAPWYPTRDEVRTWRGDIAMTDAAGEHSIWGTWAYACQPPGFRRAFRQKYRAAGYTHVVFNIALAYEGYPSCSYLGRPDAFREILRELLADHLVPVVVLATREGHGHGEQILEDLRTFLPEVRGLVPAVLTAWEMNVSGGASTYTPAEHAQVIRLADRLLDDPVRGPPYITVEFGTPSHEAPVWWDRRATGDPREYFRSLTEGRIDAVLLETGYDRGPNQNDPAMWIEDIATAVARVAGPSPLPDEWPWGGPVPDRLRARMRGADDGLHLDAVLFECFAFLRWPSERKAQWTTWAQEVVPSLRGYGDGGR